ncbi:MAG: FprA family A-type flavoprotein [Candidatus Methanoperedens sp.]|nr:FprA family A-type flavoprotein [Candidatus Methanoperedens sp.]MCE8425127.1 FprA family A-type flavoprotein [Candidatus Methanoperedens sp.]MCE8428304.1 FprA family A-type flavoprotein [Candidatus Methanoperedens sp.]
MKLVIIYGTGSHNTERMARAIEEGAKTEGMETVLRNVNDVDRNELQDADAIAVGSPNYNHAMMPTVKKFLIDISDIDLSGNVGLAFGSYGWSFEATNTINEILSSYGVRMLEDLCIKRMPGDEELEICRNAGSKIAEEIKNKEVLCAA